ncbi:MAG: mechanosensitive ion channel, partial [Deltaproteobacteria bacterium]|nr:mechanosensitive ion channel [Deltaproteobacteria bacterium]
IEERLANLEREREALMEETGTHEALLEAARFALADREREVLARLTVAAIPPPLPEPALPGGLDDVDEGNSVGEPAALPVVPELSAAERELLQLGDTHATLRVQHLERACELDRHQLSRLEAQLEGARLDLPVLRYERSIWAEKLEDLAQRASDGLLGRQDPLVTAPVLHQAASHTQVLLLNPQRTLDDMVLRIRPGRTRVPTGRGTLIAIGLVGLLSMGLVLRNRRRILEIEPRGPGEATVLHALQAALPLLPVALVSFPLYALDAVPEALHPLYRFSAWAPAVVAASVATGVSMFPKGGTATLSASIARYSRFLIRFGAAVTCVIGLINTVLPLFGYSDEVRSLLRGVSLGWILLVWLLLMVRKQEILGAIGAAGDDPSEGMIKAGIRRLYRVFALGPLAVYVLYAAGYANLAGFLVQGGLVTLAVFMLAPWVHETLRSSAAKALGYPDGGGFFALKSEGSKAAYRAVAPLLLLSVGLASLLLVMAGWNSGQQVTGLAALLTRPLFEIGGSNVSLGSLFLLGVTIVGTMLLSRQFNKLLNKVVYPIYDLDKGMRSTMDTLSGYVVMIIGLVVSLDVVGLGIGFLTVFAGVVGIGVGFGSQTLAANFIAGLILLFTRPLTVDDVIEVSGVTGRVVRIAPFSTVVRTLDNLDVVIPNSDLLGGAVVNWTGDHDHVRINVEVGVAYGSDVPKVEKLLLDAMSADPRVLRKPKPTVRFDGFGASSLDFVMLPWIDNPEDRFIVASSLRHAVDRVFREHSIEIPFPQQDLHLRSGDASLKVALENGFEVRKEDGDVLAEADPALQKGKRSKPAPPN